MRRRRFEWLGRALLLGGSLLIVLLALELFLRFADPLGQRLRGNRILLPTNQRIVLQQTDNPKLDAEIVVTRNSLGFRGPEPPSDLERRLSIVAVGGSTTECRYLSDGHDWPAVVGRELSASFDNLWVENAGLDGHSTFGHEQLLTQRVLALRPRYVLFLLGVNDVARDRLKYQDRASTQRDGEGLGQRLFDWSARHSAVVALAQNALRSRAARRLGLSQPALKLEALSHDTSGRKGRAVARAHRLEFVPGYRERVMGLVRACRAAGSEPVLITQPALYGPGNDDLTGVDLGTIEVDPLEGTNGAVAWATLEAYNDALREIGASEKVLLVDVARQLPKSSRLFYDFVHFTNEGAEEVARLVARELAPKLREQRATAEAGGRAPRLH